MLLSLKAKEELLAWYVKGKKFLEGYQATLAYIAGNSSRDPYI